MARIAPPLLSARGCRARTPPPRGDLPAAGPEPVAKIVRSRGWRREGRASRRRFFPHEGAARDHPRPGEIFPQPDLHRTLLKLVEAESEALRAGRDRRAAIMAAYDRFYRGDIA